MLEYFFLKVLHVGCVAASYALFAVRGAWMLQDSPRLELRWVRIVPHVVDTVLLASAIGLLVLLRQSPFAAGWLMAKLVALVVYIGLGIVALRRGRTRGTRIGAWIAAQAVFFYMVGVALTKEAFLVAR